MQITAESNNSGSAEVPLVSAVLSKKWDFVAWGWCLAHEAHKNVERNPPWSKRVVSRWVTFRSLHCAHRLFSDNGKNNHATENRSGIWLLGPVFLDAGYVLHNPEMSHISCDQNMRYVKSFTAELKLMEI